MLIKRRSDACSADGGAVFVSLPRRGRRPGPSRLSIATARKEAIATRDRSVAGFAGVVRPLRRRRRVPGASFVARPRCNQYAIHFGSGILSRDERSCRCPGGGGSMPRASGACDFDVGADADHGALLVIVIENSLCAKVLFDFRRSSRSFVRVLPGRFVSTPFRKL